MKNQAGSRTKHIGSKLPVHTQQLVLYTEQIALICRGCICVKTNLSASATVTLPFTQAPSVESTSAGTTQASLSEGKLGMPAKLTGGAQHTAAADACTRHPAHNSHGLCCEQPNPGKNTATALFMMGSPCERAEAENSPQRSCCKRLRWQESARQDCLALGGWRLRPRLDLHSTSTIGAKQLVSKRLA
jgi:hypothetical protein